MTNKQNFEVDAHFEHGAYITPKNKCNNINIEELKSQLKQAEQKLDKIKKVCNKFIPDHYKILLIINGGIVDK